MRRFSRPNRRRSSKFEWHRLDGALVLYADILSCQHAPVTPEGTRRLTGMRKSLNRDIVPSQSFESQMVCAQSSVSTSFAQTSATRLRLPCRESDGPQSFISFSVAHIFLADRSGWVSWLRPVQHVCQSCRPRWSQSPELRISIPTLKMHRRLSTRTLTRSKQPQHTIYIGLLVRSLPGLLAYQRTAHDFFHPRHSFERNYRKRQRSPAKRCRTRPSRLIEQFHSLFCLDISPQKNTAPFGYASWIYKAASPAKMAKTYALRRLENFRLTSETAIRSAQPWKRILNGSVRYNTRSIHDASIR